MNTCHMPGFVHVYEAESEFCSVVPAILFGGLNSEKVRVILSEVASGKEVIDVCFAVFLVKKLVNVTSEEGFNSILLDKVKKPSPCWLVKIIIVARLIW